MNIRSFMTVYEADTDVTVYVLVEGVANDCTVYMRQFQRPRFEIANLLTNMAATIDGVAQYGGKVSIRDIESLPFKIPSDLTYRA